MNIANNKQELVNLYCLIDAAGMELIQESDSQLQRLGIAACAAATRMKDAVSKGDDMELVVSMCEAFKYTVLMDSSSQAKVTNQSTRVAIMKAAVYAANLHEQNKASATRPMRPAGVANLMLAAGATGTGFGAFVVASGMEDKGLAVFSACFAIAMGLVLAALITASVPFRKEQAE